MVGVIIDPMLSLCQEEIIWEKIVFTEIKIFAFYGLSAESFQMINNPLVPLNILKFPIAQYLQIFLYSSPMFKHKTERKNMGRS